MPTNLSIRRDGCAVLGRGVAAQAVRQFPDLPALLGRHLTRHVSPRLFHYPPGRLTCLPVKHQWHERASVNLIRTGLRQLVEAVNSHMLGASVALPVLGCGFGELASYEVLPLLRQMLDDRFILVSRDTIATKRWAATLRPGIRQDRSAVRAAVRR